MLLWKKILMSTKDTEGDLKISDWYQNLIIEIGGPVASKA